MNREKENLKELYLDLRDDCHYYDQGNMRKAKDIAGRLRSLLKDGPNKKTISLLTQLGKKEIKYLDTSIRYIAGPSINHFNIKTSKKLNFTSIDNNYKPKDDNEVNIADSTIFMGLVSKKVVEINKRLFFTFMPIFTHTNRDGKIQYLDFEKWWNEVIVFEDPGKYKMTRKKIILAIAEQDGFAHYDTELDEDYKNFNENDALKLMVNGKVIKFTNSPIKATVRQIGHEVLQTLEENFTKEELE